MLMWLMPLNTSPHPRLPNNHLAGTFGLVTVKMYHPVALLNPLSWPITQELSQATLEDTEKELKVARACLHYVSSQTAESCCFCSQSSQKSANENSSATDRGYSNIHVKPVSLFWMSETVNFKCDKCNKSPGTMSSCWHSKRPCN